MNKIIKYQKEIGKNNILYFKDTMYEKIIRKVFKIILLLFISELISNKIFYSFTLIYVIFTIYCIYNLYKEYNYIISDIKNSFKITDVICIEINIKKIIINIGILKKEEENYGK